MYTDFMSDYFLMGAAVVVIIIALLYFKKFFSSAKAKPQSPMHKMLVNCPLCGSPLAKGEDLFSKVYRPMTVNDQRCTIKGCPHCYPRCEPGIKRICPVCRKTVPAEGHLVARLFNKTTDGKKHIIITGCSVCCKYEIT